MNKPILGKDVILYVYKGAGYWPYLCATNVEIDFSMETKETKTIGDGVWKRKRGQSKSFAINLDGILVIHDDIANAFDLLDYYDNMVDVQFRVIFTDADNDQRVIEGTALVTNMNLGGGSEGHATGTATLEGNGPVDIRDAVNPCGLEIETVEYLGEGGIVNFTITMFLGHQHATRFDYTMDGGGVSTKFTLVGLTKDVVITVPGAMLSTHELKIWPVCDNGYDGPVYTLNFTKDN